MTPKIHNTFALCIIIISLVLCGQRSAAPTRGTMVVVASAHQMEVAGEEEPLCPFANQDEGHDHHDHGDHDEHKECPFAKNGDANHHHDHDHHHDAEEAGDDKINNKNYREWVGEYTNSKGQKVQVPLLFTIPGTKLHLLTQRNFMDFVGGSHMVLPKFEREEGGKQEVQTEAETTADGDGGTSSDKATASHQQRGALPTKEQVSTLTVVFWYTKGCGGLCEDAYAQYQDLVSQWNPPTSTGGGGGGFHISQSLLADHKVVVQFGQYEVVPKEEHSGDISYTFGPNATQVFDFPTVTLTLATPEVQQSQGGQEVEHQVHHVKRVHIPVGFQGPLCPYSLLHNNIKPALGRIKDILTQSTGEEMKKKKKSVEKTVEKSVEKRRGKEVEDLNTPQKNSKEKEEANQTKEEGGGSTRTTTTVELSLTLLEAVGTSEDCTKCRRMTHPSEEEDEKKEGKEEDNNSLPCATFEDGILELL